MKSIVAQEVAKMGVAVPFAFEVTFADGATYRNRDEPCRFAIRFRNRAVEWGIAAFGYVRMIEVQIVFSKGNITDQNYPMGRGFLYNGAPGSSGAPA